jgi:TolB-like protein
MKRPDKYLLSVCFLAMMAAFCNHCLCQSASVLVIDFRSDVSRSFTNQFRQFGNDLGSFNAELRRQLRSSKSLGVTITRANPDSVAEALREGYGSRMQLPELRKSIIALQNADTAWSFAIAGRISDDTSNIVYVDAEIYKRTEDTLIDPLHDRIHVEASQAEAFLERTSLMSYLVQKIVLEVETRLDDRIRVLVTPFKFHGEDREMKHLGGMISALLGNRLSISQRIRVILLDSVVERQRKPGGEGYRPWTLPDLGRREAAKYVIGGSFFRQDSCIGIEADHVDVETGHSVLSKSDLITPISGAQLYARLNALGDEVRHAIELDYDIRNANETQAIAVVAAKPFPETDENSAVALEIAGAVSRMLREVPVKHGHRLSVITNEPLLRKYVKADTEVAVIGRDLNTRYLWVVRCERPGREFHIIFDISDLKNPELPPYSVRSQEIEMGHLNDSVKSLVNAVLNSYPDIKFLVDTDSTKTRSLRKAINEIEVRTPVRTVAVVPAPPYPRTADDERIAGEIANMVTVELSILQAATNRVTVIPTEQYIDEHLGGGAFDPETVGRNLHSEYLWLTEYKKLGHVRHVRMKLENLGNPFDTTFSTEFTVDHIDGLVDEVQHHTEHLLREWMPGIDSARTPEDTNKRVKGAIEEASYHMDAAGIRLRGNVLGFLENSRAVFLGDIYRGSFEVDGIYYKRPMQYELMVAFDFGQKIDDRKVYGRYITALARYNVGISCLLRDMRMYFGAGFSFLNVVRVKEVTGGRVNFGFDFTSGVEIPVSGLIFFDINSQFILPIGSTLRGSFSPADFGEGTINSASVGLGVGFRLK